MDDHDFDAIDYFRSDALVADPFPYYDHLRGTCPVQRERYHDVVMITGFDEAIVAFRDTKTFSACNAVSGPFPGFPVPLEGDDVSELIEAHRHALPMSHELMNMDPPTHTAHRTLVMRHFTPRRLRETEPYMRQLADHLIDEFIERGECEFASEFAGPFTLLNICELLGVPESDREQFLVEFLGPHRDRGLGSTSAPTPNDPFGFTHAQFTTYVEERRASPRDDVLTTVATTPFADGSMPEVIDVVRLAAALFVAGSGTTAHLLGSAFRLIGELPDLQQQLRQQPEQIANFVEETLRMESPVKGTFRLSRVPTTIAGVEVPAGSTVMLLNAAGNRDPKKFEDPNEFRLDRDNAQQHLAFGFGIHHCAGAALARAEARVGIQSVLERLRDIQISEATHGPAGARRYDYLPTYQLRGIERLHLEFSAQGG